MNVSIVLPAKNEAATIAGVVGELCERYPEAEVLVIDDGSEDGTRDQALDAGASDAFATRLLGSSAGVSSATIFRTGALGIVLEWIHLGQCSSLDRSRAGRCRRRRRAWFVRPHLERGAS